MATIPLFPLSNALFPAGVLHLRIFEVRYLDMIRRCIADGSEFGVVALLAGNEVRSPEGHETLAGVGNEHVRRPRLPLVGAERERCAGIIEAALAKRPRQYQSK